MIESSGFQTNDSKFTYKDQNLEKLEESELPISMFSNKQNWG